MVGRGAVEREHDDDHRDVVCIRRACDGSATDEYGMRVHQITLPDSVAPYQRVEFKTDDDQVVNITAPYNAKAGMKMKVRVPGYLDLSQLQGRQIPLGLLAVGEEVEEEELYASRVELLLFR